MKTVLHRFHAQLPVLSDSERDMKRELQLIPEQLRHLGNAIKQVGRGTGRRARPPSARGKPEPRARVLTLQVTMKKDYQQRKMEKVLSPQKPAIALSAYQRKCIQSVLKEE